MIHIFVILKSNFVPIKLLGKSYDIYFLAITYAVTATNTELEAISTHCDFEQPLMKAIKEQFNPQRQDRISHHVGCLFHWKQALFRYLVG